MEDGAPGVGGRGGTVGTHAHAHARASRSREGGASIPEVYRQSVPAILLAAVQQGVRALDQ
jgi:hypothetical protein